MVCLSAIMTSRLLVVSVILLACGRRPAHTHADSGVVLPHRQQWVPAKHGTKAPCLALRGGGYDPFAKPKEAGGGKDGGKGGGGKGGMSDAERRIADIEAEMARTQKNKATMGHLCALKARLAALKRTVTEQQTKRSTGPGEGFDVRATGDARVGFIGFPSVGKSTLLTQLTGVESEAADYEFTTLTCIPGTVAKPALHDTADVYANCV